MDALLGPSSIMLLLGVLLLFAAIIGGGVEIKELKIPKIDKTPRLLTALLGMGLLMCGGAAGVAAVVARFAERPVATMDMSGYVTVSAPPTMDMTGYVTVGVPSTAALAVATTANEPIATGPSATEAVLASSPIPNSTVIEYGQTLSVLPRQAPTLYTFTGTQGDEVLVKVATSNVSNHPFCAGKRVTSTWSLKNTELVQIGDANSSTVAGTTETYTLPYTCRYYISTTCIGGGCDGFCAQTDLHIEKK